MIDYKNLTDMLSSTANMLTIRDNSKQDDGTDVVDGVDWFKFKDVVAAKLYVNGNGWIGFGSNAEHLKVNRRDQAMWSLWREEATLSEGQYKVLRIRWQGYSRYNYTSSSYLLIYDCILMDNGRIFVSIDTWPTSYADGTNQLVADNTVSFSPSTGSKFTFRPLDDTNSTYAVSDGFDEPEYSKTRYLVTDSTGTVYSTKLDGFEPGPMGPNLVDNIVHAGYFPSANGITFSETTNPVGNYVVPIVPGTRYILRCITSSNRNRIVTCKNDPSVDLNSAEGVRNLYTNDTVVTGGYELDITADTNENFLNIYFSNNVGQSGYIVPEFTVQKWHTAEDFPANLSPIPDVTIDNLTADTFLLHGTETLDGSVLIDLTDPTILKWKDKGEPPTIGVDIRGVAIPSNVYCVADMNNTDITGIGSMEATYTGQVLVAYSYDGVTYVDAQDIAQFLAADLTSLYNGLGSPRKLWLRFTLSGEATLTNFVINYTHASV